MSIKGQVSIEYLLLTLVSFILLGVSISALMLISNTAKTSVQHEYKLRDKNLIQQIVNEVCLLGSGTSVKIQLLSSYDSLSIESTCEVNVENNLKGTIIIENRDGKVYVYNKH